MQKYILLPAFLLFVALGSTAHAQANKVIMHNTGKMNIAAGGHNGVAIYVKGALMHSGANVGVTQHGTSNIGGNFYQNSTTHVFNVDALTTTTPSTGTVRFVDAYAHKRRYVTTNTPDSLTAVNFDRGNHYVAFPKIEIGTTDSLIIPARMGIDARSVKRAPAAPNAGKMVLRSDALTTDGATRAYDASLRITDAGASAALTDAGQVIVERHVGTYRNTANQPLFPFASPFLNTQLSGYFAGNWVRRPVADDAAHGSTYYIFGNRDADGDNIIDRDQYVYVAAEKLVPAQGYLIKPRPQGFGYEALKNSGGLWYTGADPSLYDKDKLVFDGAVYTVPYYPEQLFAEDRLVSKTLSGVTSERSINWLFGNSYSAPISTELLRQAVSNSSLKFVRNLYVFVAGSQTYQPIDLTGTTAGITVADYPEIPAMSVFMLVLPRNTMQTGSFEITKQMLRHGVKSHGTPNRAPSGQAPQDGINGQINFRLTPADNDNLYDLAAIGLRNGANMGADDFDVTKFYTADPQSFQLYTLSAEGTKLAANGIPPTAGRVTLAVRPSVHATDYSLTVSNVASIAGVDGVWLTDTHTGATIDLRQNPTYTFSASPDDKPERFVVHFGEAENPTTDDTPPVADRELNLHNLTPDDVGATLKIFTVQGSLVWSGKVTTYPVYSPQSALPAGNYIISLEGAKRSATIKAVRLR